MRQVTFAYEEFELTSGGTPPQRGNWLNITCKRDLGRSLSYSSRSKGEGQVGLIAIPHFVVAPFMGRN